MFKKKTKTTIVIAALGALISMNSFDVNAADHVTRYPNTYDTNWYGGGTHNYNPTAYPGTYNRLTDICNEISFSDRAKYCHCRRKTNDSSVYVYNKSYTDAKVDVFFGRKLTTSSGLTYPSGRWAVTIEGNIHSGWLDCSDVRIPKNKERKIYQFIYENRAGAQVYAHLHFKTPNTYGYWSPDCAYEWSYQAAN